MKKSILILYLLISSLILFAQPAPGDLYKEYKWFNESGDCNGALRIGGRLDYQLIKVVDDYQGKGEIAPPFDLDLEYATKAELVVEKMLCHGGTEGLRVSVNGNKALRLPEAEAIPSPQSAYAHHFNAIVPVDLKELKQGPGNSFLFEVDTAGHWWPQNLVYGMVLRIYYEPDVVPKKSSIAIPSTGDQIGLKAKVEFDHPDQKQVEGIDLVAYYDGPDLEGDGLWQKWHYAFHKGEIYGHIGSLDLLKKQGSWDTEWLPDQEEAMKLAAFVHLKNGYRYMTEAVEDLVLKREEYSVELCKPYLRPKGWFTRNGEFSERFQIKGNLEQAMEARMVFRTWSPDYFNGIYINDFLVFTKEGPKYDYFEHDIALEGLYSLKQGENILKTGKTPLYPEGMVHGVEVQWPGVMLLIKYEY